MAPTLPGRFEWLSSATDNAGELADQRLQAVLGQVSEMEGRASASGTVGADDPLLAFEDAVAELSPYHIGLRSADRFGWQQSGLIDQLVARLGLPITIFQVPDLSRLAAARRPAGRAGLAGVRGARGSQTC